MFNCGNLAEQHQLFKQGEKCISGMQFLADVHCYRQKIQKFIRIKGERGQHKPAESCTILLFHPDVYQFAVRLFALSGEQIQVILPANSQIKTVEGLLPLVDAIAGEYEQHVDFSSIENIAESLDKTVSFEQLLWPINATLVFSTSGSSGQAKLIEKSWQQLSIELATLIDTFALDNSTVFLSTVSHQHIYGLLFRLLWPLSQGATIEQTIEYPEHGRVVLQQSTSVVLVSSPAFLKRLALDNVLEVNKQNIVKIFSSGGPLADHDALMLFEQFEQGVIQVYGSTETGGIGYRTVTAVPAPNWQVFSGISLSCHAQNKQFVLNSPYINELNMLLDDKGEVFEHGEFSLLGRVDRTVKVEEKRVNLDDVEQQLLASNLVKECRVLVLNDKRATLAAVICLSESGLLLRSNLSDFDFNQQMKQHLLERFERVCLPRKWRYLNELPYNSQGKLSQSALEALFE